jgi:hypothetical protein
MGYALLADLVVAAHAAYVGYVLVGQLAILAGALLKWQWVRNPTFRLTHLLAILIVAGESLLDITCPLTVWEDQLRDLAGQSVEAGSFIGRTLHNLLFFDVESGFFTWIYVGFAALVLSTLVLLPPRWQRAQAGAESSQNPDTQAAA